MAGGRHSAHWIGALDPVAIPDNTFVASYLNFVNRLVLGWLRSVVRLGPRQRF